MHDLITLLVEAIYSEPRAGRLMPARIELGPDLFRQFQLEHREALAAMLPEAGNVYPGSLAGVPVVKVAEAGAALIRMDGRRKVLPSTSYAVPPLNRFTTNRRPTPT